MTDAPPVLVEWVDSRQPTSQWEWLGAVRKLPPVRCQTAGFLVHDGADVKMVAQNVGDLQGSDLRVPGVITIPARAVTRITNLAAGSGRR